MAYTTIKKPSDYFNTKLYTGTGATQSITGVGFQPDWVWCKSRSGADNHAIFDAVRGGQKQLRSNTTDAELTRTNAISSFDSDGWSMGSQPEMNSSGTTYASWNWLADNTSGSSNTDGSITSTVSANTTSGFSIVSYTGDGSSTGSNVVGHGLGTTPSMIIIKARAGTYAVNNWYCWHKGLSANNNIALNLTSGQFTTALYTSGLINTSPTATTFGFDSGTSLLNINESGATYIAYCFADVQGYSKFSSYTGNGSADGTFVYTGFKPAFVIRKRTDNTNSWAMNDNKRSVFNVTDDYLLANTSDAEVLNNAAQSLDLLSNGFKCRGTGAGTNASGGTYIYMAFAEEPLVGDNPATAR